MPEIAKSVKVDLKAEKLYVDGVEFPWFIDESGPVISGLTRSEIPSVTITLLAETVEVVPRKHGSD